MTNWNTVEELDHKKEDNRHRIQRWGFWVGSGGFYGSYLLSLVNIFNEYTAFAMKGSLIILGISLGGAAIKGILSIFSKGAV